MPKLSVIVPIYGAEKYIECCARSLFEQTLEDIEFLFIDDCSPDDSIKILKCVLKEYPQREKQVTIHRMAQNGGQAIAREWGVRNATGEYITHCDSDDWVDVRMYENMYEVAKAEKSDIVICDFCVTDGKGYSRRIKASKTETKRFLENCLYGRCSWSLCNKLIQRHLYSNIEFPHKSMGEDFAIMTQLLEKANKISYIPEVFYYYYQNSDSTIHKVSEEAILQRFYQLSENTNIVIKHLGQSSNYKNIIRLLKPYLLMNACIPLLGLFANEKYRLMWRQSCPHLSLWYLVKTPFPIYSKYTYLKYSIKYWFKK